MHTHTHTAQTFLKFGVQIRFWKVIFKLSMLANESHILKRFHSRDSHSLTQTTTSYTHFELQNSDKYRRELEHVHYCTCITRKHPLKSLNTCGALISQKKKEANRIKTMKSLVDFVQRKITWLKHIDNTYITSNDAKHRQTQNKIATEETINVQSVILL